MDEGVCLTQRDEDGLVTITQKIFRYNPTILFGPVGVRLFFLGRSGFFLRVQYYPRRSYGAVAIYLTDGKSQRYKIQKVKSYKFSSSDTLCSFIKNNTQMINRGALNAELMDQDPWQALNKKYPPIQKKMMIGNMTLREKLNSVVGGGRN